MIWLRGDRTLLEADAAQLRRHLGWLLAELRASDAAYAVETAAVRALVAAVAGCLARLGALDRVLAGGRRAVR